MARIWLAVSDEPPHVRHLVRLLCLLPLRRDELTDLSWSEVKGVTGKDVACKTDPDRYTGPNLDIPAHRMKGRRPQMMPLPPLALAILREANEDRGADGDYVFSVTAGRTPYAGWRTLAGRLSERCQDMPAGWVRHDIRGGISTALGERGVDEAIIARLLHHAPAGRIGITAKYDRSRRLASMLEALEIWEVELTGAVAAEEREQACRAARSE
jgi:integrase